MKQLYSFPAEELQQDTVYLTITQTLEAVSLTNDKDRIQLKKLIDEARNKVNSSDLDSNVQDELTTQLDQVAQAEVELTMYEGGLVIYVTPNETYYYHLAVEVKERAVLHNTPYILPLAANFQFTQSYHLLVLNRDSIRLFEGAGQHIQEIDIKDKKVDAPLDLETALGTEQSGGDQGSGANTGGGAGGLHGHNDANEEKDIDRENYFNIVDKFIYENYSKATKLPLILFTTTDNESVFRNISDNKYLIETTINGSASGLDNKQIADKTGVLILKLITMEQVDLLNRLNETTPENKVVNLLDDLASISVQGRISDLYVEKDYTVVGTITPEGQYKYDDEANDYIQQLVSNVIKAKGNLYVFTEDELPGDTHLAARLRY